MLFKSDFRKKGKDGEGREREKHPCERNIVSCLLPAPQQGNQTSNLVMFPDWESNPHLSVYGITHHPMELHWPGLYILF